MTGTQTTLTETVSRGCETTGETTAPARVVLTTDRENSLTHAAKPVFAEMLSRFSVSGFAFEEAYDTASGIVDSGSPARRATAHPEFDCIIYAWGRTIEEAASDVAALDAVHPGHVVVPDIAALGESCDEIVDSLDVLAALDPDKLTVVTGTERIEIPTDTRELYGLVSGLRLADRVGLAKQRAAERRDVLRWASEDKDDGRAGLAFEWSGGEWVPASNYDEVCAVLRSVKCGEMSKSLAAEHLGTSSRTITRCLKENPDRYGL